MVSPSPLCSVATMRRLRESPSRVCRVCRWLNHSDFRGARYSTVHHSFGGFMSLWCTRLQSAPQDGRLHESWSLAWAFCRWRNVRLCETGGAGGVDSRSEASKSWEWDGDRTRRRRRWNLGRLNIHRRRVISERRNSPENAYSAPCATMPRTVMYSMTVQCLHKSCTVSTVLCLTTACTVRLHSHILQQHEPGPVPPCSHYNLLLFFTPVSTLTFNRISLKLIH